VTSDTTPEFEKLVRERFLALAPAERVSMCADMFETARALVEASLPAGLDAIERRRRICRRFYGDLADKAFPVRLRRSRIGGSRVSKRQP